jgi:hypothetical protein
MQITKPVATKTVVVKDGGGQVLSKTVHTQQPLGSNADTMYFNNGLPIAQRIKTETNSPKFKITSKPSTLKTTPQQVEYFDKSPFFSRAYKAVVQHNPAVMGKEALKNKGWLNNNPTADQLIEIRKELYEMLPIEKSKGYIRNAEQDTGGNQRNQQNDKSYKPADSKADKTFSRSKGVEKGYESRLTYSGRKAGKAMPKDTSSFIRGILEQIKINTEHLPDKRDINST